MLSIETRGFDKAIRRVRRMERNVPKQLEEAVEETVGRLTPFAESITPVQTGSMARAWVGEARGLRAGILGRIFIDPGAVNDRTGVPVSSYAGVVAERYGIMEQLSSEAGQAGAEALGRLRW